MFDLRSKLGALLHVNGGDYAIGGRNHLDLLDGLLKIVDFPRDAAVFLFMDENPLGQKEDARNRLAFLKKMARDIQEYGFKAPEICKEGEGKFVMLDTDEDWLTVFDRPLFSRRLKS